MTHADIEQRYRAYIDCLNARAWDALSDHVHPEVRHNGRLLGVPGYRAMLERDVRQIPDLRFVVDFLICGADRVAVRLLFDCRPADTFLDLPVRGRRVTFAENVFYAFQDERIVEVWSVVDKAAIEAQLAETSEPDPRRN